MRVASTDSSGEMATSSSLRYISDISNGDISLTSPTGAEPTVVGSPVS